MTVGDRRLTLPPVGGFSWETRAGAASEATGVARRVGEFRQQMELALAEELARPDRLVVLDGRLSFVRDVGGPVVGAIKSHHRMYLPPDEARTVVALRVGERTPLFAIGEDRLSWYQRLPGVGGEGWAGILRGEAPRSLGTVEAARLADRAAAELPRFAGRPHRDPRAPQNLSPIAGLEWRLRHRMGDRRLALRAVRRSALRARLDAGAAGAGGGGRGRRRGGRMSGPVGVVLGHQAASSQVFTVGLADDQTLEVDDLVAVTTTDSGGDVTTFGIVTETYAQMEGASLPSDTQIIAAGRDARRAGAHGRGPGDARRPRALDRAPPRPAGAPRARPRARPWRSTRTP